MTRAGRHAIGSILLKVLVFAVFVGVWEGAVRVLHISPIILPSPVSVVESLWTSVASGELTWHLAVTVYEILSGFFLGSAIGLVLGFIVALWPLAERLLYPYVVAFQTVPKVAIAPIIVVWFGYGVASKIVITATIAFFPVLANTIVGLRSAPQEQVEMLVTYTASRWQVFRMVRLQQALPYIFAGLDIAIVLSVIGAIVGEFVGAQAGLGFLLLQKNFNFDIAGTFAILIVLSLVGVGLHDLLKRLRKRVVFWVDLSGDSVSGA